MDIPQKDILDREGQGHVLRFFDKLDAAGRAALLKQVDALDFASIDRMRKLLAERGKASAAPAAEPEPAPVVEFSEKEQETAAVRGEAELRAGKVGVVLVAGGQGSRLGFDGPKGAYPVGPLSNRPLFFFHARKILALSRAYGAPVPFYIMTSETNDAATRDCFEANGYFGLDKADVHFFKQGMWPALDPDGKIILDRPDHIFMSPDGHGGTISALKANGLLDDMERRGLSTVFYFQVDNPLVAIADPAFIGLHLLRGADISIKVCAKRDPQEGLGMVVERGGRCEMVEYTEFTDEQKNRRRADGDLYYKFGSVAIHVFSFDFLKREAAANMPLHIAHKKIAHCADDGQIVKPDKPNGYKFEKFIFDVLPDATTVVNVAFDRADEFSPVKNAEGNDSPATCRHDLVAKWTRWFDECGVKVPAGVTIEIDPAFANSPKELMTRLCSGFVPVFDGRVFE